MKKTLSTRLRERTETIEFRAIKSKLMVVAQNKGNSILLMHIQPETITMLQNELLTVEQIQDHGYKKYRISW